MGRILHQRELKFLNFEKLFFFQEVSPVDETSPLGAASFEFCEFLRVFLH